MELAAERRTDAHDAVDEELPDNLDRFPHPHLAVDVVLLTLQAGALHVLLLRRANAPFAGAYGLPGGFVHVDESVAGAAERVLATKCGLQGVFLEQLFTFGELDRDPRGRVVSVAYYALVPATALAASTSRDVVVARVEVPWSGTVGGPVRTHADGRQLRLAFDHNRVLGTAVQRLRGKIDYAPVGFELLPAQFTLADLLAVHEAVLGRSQNKDSFRRRLLASGQLAPTGRTRGGAHRPAALYRFRSPRSSGRRPA